MENTKLNELFEELVPAEGKCESLAGEIVRAVMRIAYRWWNDGDRVNEGYGKETCNAAARFLCKMAPKEVAEKAEFLWVWGTFDNQYEELLQEIADLTVKAIEDHPELREQETPDMFDFTDPELDRDDSYDDDEDDYYEEEEYYDDEMEEEC